MPQSYYHASRQSTVILPKLEGELTVDVAIVGAGFTGLSCALTLAEQGYSVAVLEAEDIGTGGSGLNGGQICTGYHHSYESIAEQFSLEIASHCVEIAKAGPQLIAKRVEQYGIDCDLQWGYLHAAEKSQQLDTLAKMAEDWFEWGYTDHQLLHKHQLASHIQSSHYVGGLWEAGAGHFHPLNYLDGLAKACVQNGVSLFTHSPVTRLIKGDKPQLKTALGTVSAKFVVLAGNAYLNHIGKRLRGKRLLIASDIIATAPLTTTAAVSLLPNNDAVANTRFVVDYFRRTADNRLLFGGRADNMKLPPEQRSQSLKQRMLKVFPQLSDHKIDFHWSGNVAVTTNQMPDIGRLDQTIYYAQGYSGHGVALSNQVGHLLANVIQGQAEQFDALAHYKPIAIPVALQNSAIAIALWYFRLRDRRG